ncbi:MAG: serine/threonine protein kinase [Chloroflexi bacterium]|jgi:serine/threonine protein kinase|nr:serine/threonine protein kinase [Chloroflexota bacterium]
MTKLGKYELIEEIGRGGYGTVYRARETVLDVERAVKVLHPALIADPEFIERFRREAKIAAQLEHPHIVPVYELDEYEGSFFLVMKHMPGASLKDVLARQGRLSYERALEITRQVAEALDFAHQKGLVHRDIKPANILFEQDINGETRVVVRLSDFGFAKAIAGTNSASLSASGAMIGTPAYMAPEVWRGKDVTPATDVYSLACVFYEMLTGEVLFAGDSPPEVMTKHVLDGPQFPTLWVDGVPESVGAMLERALDRDEGKRIAVAGEFVSALKEISAQQHVHMEIKQITAENIENFKTETLEQRETEKKTTLDKKTQNQQHTNIGVDEKLISPQPVSFSWKVILWISLGWAIGWAIGGAIVGTFIKWAFWGFNGVWGFDWIIGGITGGAIGGAINGLITGWIMKSREFNWKSVMWISLGWAIGGVVFGRAIGWAINAIVPVGTLGTLSGTLSGAIGGLIGGLITGWVLNRREFNRKTILWITLGWAIGGAIVSWAIGRTTINIPTIDIQAHRVWAFVGTTSVAIRSGAFVGAIGGAIGGSVMLWQLKRAQGQQNG